MRFSKSFIPTFKEAPKDVVLKSHEYLIRAGFIQQIGSGIYNFLPLGKRVLDKIRSIVKEEMDNSGANEVALGFVTPASLWKESGRFERYGKELLRFSDRKDNVFVLGPTHEEVITELVKANVKSYKQLPLHLYQINLKFRDEMRPRFGLMRAREFIMKDGYSFHSSFEDLKREFDLMEQTYSRIFTRLGLDFRVVFADSGAIGGSGSKEFMVLAKSGEDTICVCDTCSYGANLEAATRIKIAPNTQAPQAEFAKFHTPGVKNIEALAEFFKITSFWTLKAVVKKAIFDEGKSALVYFFLRGSDTLNTTKALNAISGANALIEASEEEIKAAGLIPGFIGPFALRNLTGSPYIYFDNELQDAGNLICGANALDYHFVGVDLSTFEGIEYKDLVEVQAGDLCPMCGESNGGKLYFTRGIEVGHIFQLGTKYSSAMEATFLDEMGKAQPFIMGCYGIGVSRLLSAVIEQHHDERGMIWTSATAPFSVDIMVSNIKDSAQLAMGEKIYTALRAQGIECLLDDRAERYGVKIADFELIGLPFGIVVGKGLQKGEIEIIKRRDLSREVLKISDFVALVAEIKTLVDKCH
ncbi:proline--tRNA ligase [Helicobacter turcicus]|uniref:Proline--tRNA ligase n=1 Tax=Helicobacter turcicus TaxID=2867412 RepID=A0ABS7JMX1_9HELI|nr:proline--tRNA ligase [Helicobacter turcicus]MBX7490754.1 proline--tRNA ligase [Helicobacter turcicus]MBX7545637.1 proline--tRNA ligase [Helicobacter turcicus]